MKRKLKWGFGVAAAGFALLQLTNPARTNPPVIHDLMAVNPPPLHLAATLHAACYDCHSSETRWPWYARVAPVSWLIAGDVRAGRAHLNLSDWPESDPKRAAKWLDRMSEEIRSGEMPPAQYLKIHADGWLTDSQRKELADWLEAQEGRLEPAAGK